jgi:tetratricopeptide (TPR) repeat protein
MTADAAAAPDPLAAFRQLLEHTRSLPDAERPLQYTDRLVGPTAAVLLRRCAVPHEFDRALLQRLGDLDEAEADARYAEFAELSLMELGETTLAVHERWRAPLWRWWLQQAQRDEFTALSERLVAWFTLPANATGEDPAARRRMFHLIGCRRDEGLQAFETLFRAARHRRRVSECSLLLRLAHEYDPLLAPGERARLDYQEGKLASDLRDWERALPLLRAVAAEAEADPRLRAHALVRVGHALRQSGCIDDALALLEGARAQFEADPALAGSVWRLLYELGEVYRDQGRADAARATLSEALATADDGDEEADAAGLLNSLGTAQLKLHETDAAIASFRASLAELERGGDALRSGGVLNNLGLAQLERCDWAAAEASFAASLERKRQAGDLPGQAAAWLSISRVQAARKSLTQARQSAEQAATAFGALGDTPGRARARLAVARLLRRSGQRADAAALLTTLLADASAGGDELTAAAARAELLLAEQRGGLRWWVWGLIVLALALLVLVAVVLVVAER